MQYDLQKATLTKRFSAWLLDAILLAIVAVGFALALSALLGFDNQVQTVEACYTKYEAQYSIRFDLSAEDYSALLPEEKLRYDQAFQALSADPEAVYAYNMTMQLTVLITSFSIFCAFLLLEFAVPLWLKNGQTVGKKVFGVAIIRTDGVQLQSVALFIRTVLGKYAIETMIPVFMLLMIFMGTVGILGPIAIGLILLVQLVLLVVTRTNSLIHDLLANTVAVDLSSQMIFRTTEELMAYQQKIAAEKAARSPY